jgi:hypothetical protein
MPQPQLSYFLDCSNSKAHSGRSERGYILGTMAVDAIDWKLIASEYDTIVEYNLVIAIGTLAHWR